MKQKDLVGKTLSFVYSNETYRIEVLNDSQVRWTQTEGPKSGQGDTETYVFSALSEDIGLITWIEADGLGLSNALNFAQNTVTTHANQGRDVFENVGRLEIPG